MEKGDKVKLIGSEVEYYYISTLSDGNVELTTNKNNLYFGNKFVSSMLVYRDGN